MLSSDISIHGFFISLPYRDKSLFQITLIIIEKRSSMESLWDFIFTKRYRKNKNKIGRRRWNKKILWFIIFSTAILISLLCLWSHSLCYFQFHQHRRKRKCGWEEKKVNHRSMIKLFYWIFCSPVFLHDHAESGILKKSFIL